MMLLSRFLYEPGFRLPAAAVIFIAMDAVVHAFQPDTQLFKLSFHMRGDLIKGRSG